MAPWKRTMPTIVLLLLGSISTNVHADITKAPSSGVFLEGSDVTLTCVVEGNDYVVWDDLSDATSIFIGKKKNNEKKKYDNFGISSVDGDFSLIIKDVQISDEGTYVCKDQDRHATATVTIGVLPNVHLSVKQTEATQAPQTSTEVNITCSAYNARPAVSVFELSVIGSEKTVNITNDKSNQNEDGITYNSSASLPYIMSSEEMSVYCRVFTAGRSLNHTEKFYKPRCNITMSGNEIRCLCQANPQVKSYYMDVNGNHHNGDVLFIEEDDPMNIRCFARNELGTGQSDLLFPDDIYGFGLAPVAVIVSVVVLLVVLTVIYIRHRLGLRDKNSDEEQPTVHGANEGESVNLLSQSENKTDEKGQMEAAEVSPDKNEEDTKSCGREHTPPGKLSNVNEEMSERNSTNDEDASSFPPPQDSSSPHTNLTGDLKASQKFISDILLKVNKDWEIFAIEVLNISEKVVEEAVMKNDNFADQINAVTENMTSYHIEVLCNNATLCKQFGLECGMDNNGCLFQSIDKTNAEASHEQDPTYISSSDNILDCCGTRIGKVGIIKLLEAFARSRIETDDGATLLKTFEKKDVIKKPYVHLLRKLTDCKMYGARKILLLNFKTDIQQLEATLRNHVKKDWEIFAIEILNMPEKLVEDAVINYDTYIDQIEVVIKEITAEHIGMMDDINTNNKLENSYVLSEINLQSVEEEGRYYFKNMKSTQSDDIEIQKKLEKKNKLSEFNLQFVEKEGRYYFRNIESAQSEQSSNEDITSQQDPPTIESRDDMLKLSRDRIGKVGIRRLLKALAAGDCETEDEINVLKKLDENGVIEKHCAKLLSNLSDCKLFRARKIVFAHLEADLWKYITNNLCPQITLDWEIFAVDVLGLEKHHVVDIIEHTKDEKGQVLSMFRKWKYMHRQQKKVSKQFLQELINANKISSKIVSKDNRPKDVTALKVNPTNEGDCSKEFEDMLTTCNMRIGEAGSERLAVLFLNSSGASERISVDDSVNSLGQLCCMLYKANLFTARDVVITYIEKQLHELIASISEEGASYWDKVAKYGLSLSEEDVLYLERADRSNKERVRMAISKWMRKTNISKDVKENLKEKAPTTFSELDLWKYIINNLCPQISVDWEIFAVDVLGLETHYVVDIIEQTKDEKGQVLSMFRKWGYMCGQQQNVSKQLLQNLVKANELSGKIMSKDNRLKDVTALKVKPTNEGDCSKAFLAMLTKCSKRIGVVGSKRLAEINSKGSILKVLVAKVVVGTSYEAPEGISVDDSVDSLEELCYTLSKANLFTARDVVITYIEEKRVRMAISKWMRKTNISKDVEENLKEKASTTFSELDLWNYIINDLCPQISVDWEIFAFDVLDLETLHVVDIIEHTKDEKGQVLSMFRKWRYMDGQQQIVSKQSLQNLVQANELSGKIMSKDNRIKDVTALKVKPSNEGACSKEFSAMLTKCNERIGVVGSKTLAENNSEGSILKGLVATVVVGTSSEASEGVSVDDSVESLGQLCFMLRKANLFTARDVVITYIEKQLQNEIANISEKRASDWETLATVGLSLSEEDVVDLKRASKSNEERVRMAFSKWMRKKDIDKDFQKFLKDEKILPGLGISDFMHYISKGHFRK